MLTALYTGASGMDANSTALSVVGDNIANLNTTGFKGARVNFGDVLSQTITGAAGSSQVGLGVRVDRISSQFTQGSFENTGNVLDMAIDGDGFFVLKAGAAKAYTRAGQFSLDKNGYVVNSEGYRLQGFIPDSSGTINGVTGDINFSNQQSKTKETTTADIAVNLNGTGTVQTNAFTLDGNGDGIENDPANYNESTTIKVYDSLGGAHDINIYYCKTGTGAWTAHYVHADPTNSESLVEAGSQTLTFGTDGSLTDDGGTVPIAFNFGVGVVTPQAVTFNYGSGTGETQAGTGFDGSTQFSAPFSVSQLTQDGYGASEGAVISISETGIVSASFTNGQSRTIGQVALGCFMDPTSLAKLGKNLYGETYASGQAVVASPEISGAGRVLSNTLELSNVDLAHEFVKLISAQRAFQANSRIITTTDDLLQELVNLKR